MRTQIDAVLDKIRPAVRAHGGEIEIVSIDVAAGVVRLKFRGACGECALAPITLKLGIAPLLKKEFAWIREITTE